MIEDRHRAAPPIAAGARCRAGVEHTGRDGDGDHVVDRRPEEVLLHLAHGRLARAGSPPARRAGRCSSARRCAVSMATSVPAPMAMPRSACASAGASLTPSPTIATNLPSSCSCLTSSALSCGQDLGEDARRCPSSRATASAVRRLSPVIMRDLDAQRLEPGDRLRARVGRMRSAAATSPAARPSTATSISGLALGEQRARRSRERRQRRRSALRAASRLPTSTRCAVDRRRARRQPGEASKSSTAGRVRARARARPSTMACASGCSRRALGAAGEAQQLVLVDSHSAATTSVTRGLALGQRAGLVEDDRLDREACSSEAACLNRMPWRAPMPVATTTAVGVASPSASGQAMTTARDGERQRERAAVSSSDEVPDQERQQPRADRRRSPGSARRGRPAAAPAPCSSGPSRPA